MRKHLSRIKGGRLARACHPAQLITYAISDVPGDHPAVIASGPTVADTTSSAEALAILQRYDIKVGPHILDWLQNPDSETLKANDPVFVGSQFHLIATAAAVPAGSRTRRPGGRYRGAAAGRHYRGRGPRGRPGAGRDGARAAAR